MAISTTDFQSIVTAVLGSLQTNSLKIEQLTPATTLSDDDVMEVGGGKKVTYAKLKELLGNAIKDGMVPDYTEFAGFVSGKTVNENASTSTSDAAGKAVYYDTILNTFLLFDVQTSGTTTTISDSGYKDWKDGNNFGTPIVTGREPHDGKLYADVSTGRLYRAEVGKLVLLGSGFKSLALVKDGLYYEVRALNFLGKSLSAIDLPVPLCEVPWKVLMNLRRTKKLIPGQMYRITDYITTVANDPEARSAGHPFDVVVTALTNDTLSEEACAIHSARDTAGYFADAKLQAWKIWYCLDNDTTRFQWADSVNGKGVIYRMIDEWQNDCPYDFKNIQFKRYYTTGTFVDDYVDDTDWVNTHYILGANWDMGSHLVLDDTSDFEWFYTFNKFDDSDLTNLRDASLINSTYSGGDDAEYWSQACHTNKMNPCFSSQFIDDDAFSMQILNNIVTTACDPGNGDSVKLNSNTWGPGCFNMTFHEHCFGNTFGADCHFFVAFKFGYNTFGNNCWRNTFGNNCWRNTFGNNCWRNTFGNDCWRNTFGNSYSGNTFGNDCDSNTFGNDCDSNTFGNSCQENTFGNNCWRNTFGNSYSGNTFGNYVYACAIGDGVQYLNVSDIGSEQKKLQYAHILNGTCGTSDTNKLTVTFVAGTAYSQYAGLNSTKQLKIWTPADLVS